ncbi:metalloendoproteinase 2-MMP-like [Corylus avellana]|uniref:metalloendoproteinase 2-MMP-like n=1 Tax=Corylus avellana TaxID=13451 RepID=UPI00286B962B|nr:metalloendoproteinase 2-MMP-like [Corylus avellana]
MALIPVLLLPHSPDMLEEMRAAMQQAFSEWQRNSGFTFIQNPPAAYALPPPFGEKNFHADENWSIDPTKDQFDLVSVALHEIGHVLGLRHLSVKDAVMSPDSHYGVGKRKLHRLDIAALAVMYNQWGRFLRTIFS